ncbi:class I SAM-dependent methyltransferase [Paraburkholderia elongata]|uniref:class I SAM-dependent methyltransferase n=1 Tax=Paraburkholderia elongata TaxID=2675747 RepID=UPI002E289555|nr:class I SAM-dependent methyltransferase [Paraburkholderia elongata]
MHSGFRIRERKTRNGSSTTTTYRASFVGIENLPAYFRRIRERLAVGGVAMNHGITATDADCRDTPLGGGTFIDKYVFPAGEVPHVSMALRAMQACPHRRYR